MSSAAPGRPALRYHGSKFRLAHWILSHFPAHHAYVEPYGGAMGVLLQKDPSPVEVYNDLSKRVVGFFRVLRERPDALIRAIELTPFARAEFEMARDEPWPVDDLEAARRLYILAWQGRGGPPAVHPGMAGEGRPAGALEHGMALPAEHRQPPVRLRVVG